MRACLLRAWHLKDFYLKGSGVWLLSSIEPSVCSLLNGKITGRLGELKRRRLTLCVRMCVDELQSCYDNIVRRLCVCPFLLCWTIGTLCDVQGPSSHNGNYVFSQPDWQFFIVGAKETRKGGRRESWPAAQLQGGVNLWGVEGQKRKQWIDLCTFVYLGQMHV